MRRQLSLSNLTYALVLACLPPASAVAAAGKIDYLESPAATNSSLSRVTRDENGRVYLSWVEQLDAGASRLLYAELIDGAWSGGEEISRGDDWFINWADFPMLSVIRGNKAAHWLRRSAEGTYDYDIEATFFAEQRWSEPRIIHSDGISAEHGFVSMLPMPGAGTLISWLDGRNSKTEDGYGEMTLRAGVFDAGGTTMNEWELDARVCDCCQTSAAMTRNGPIIVYRDRSLDEIRDIYIIRQVNGAWTTPQAIHHDDWQIAGCPVNGPAVSAQGNRVAVGWFAAKDDHPQVKLALSADGGASFDAPVLVAGGHTIGRVGTTLLDSGRIAVSWLDTELEQARIQLTLYSPQGEFISSSEIATTSPSRRSGFPIITAVGETVYVSWTDVVDSRVKTARVGF